MIHPLPLAILAALAPPSLPASSAEQTRPNVVLILADDLGYADVGCFGATGFATPNLDRLARQGRRFTNFHVAQPVCSASRAALLTGCYANRVGIHGALGPGATHGIADREETLAELLKRNGYATGMAGKWHLGHHPRFLPMRHGFDEYFGLPYSNDMWPHHPEARPGTYPPLPLIEGDRVVDAEVTPDDQRRLTARFTERAVSFIARHKDRPFFFYLAHSMPHVPLFVGEEFLGKSQRGLYGDVIMEIDWSVGEILKALRDHDLERDTLVIFTSDNGPWLSYGEHAGNAGPLREGKGTCWEGGVRVPCIMRWPGQLPADTACDAMLMTIDLVPTIARLVGAELPEHTIDGLDVWPLLAGVPGARNPHDAYLFYYEKNQLQAVASGDGRWKLQLSHTYRTLAGRPGGRGGTPAKYEQRVLRQPELYHLRDDPGETTDVAARHPEVVRRLLDIAERARADLGDSLTERQGRGIRPAGLIPAGTAVGGERPNLVWIMADDLGYGDLGCYGQKVIRTPHLDRMAREGTRFIQFYAGATVCAPSRSVLMTGQHQGHTRVRGNAGRANPAAQALRDDDITVARVLSDAGYVTALIGKWGLGDVGAAETGLPRRQGFDSFFGYLNQTHAHNHFPDYLWRNEEEVALPNRVTPVGVAGGGYATEAVAYADDLFAAEALKFVAANKGRPFFLYWSMVTPHANNERARALNDGAHVPDYGPYAGEDWPAPDKGQAAMITRLDAHVGRLLGHLKELGIAERTLVILTSDNGPHDESRHDLARFDPSGPLRGIKRSLTEGGIRVPLVAWWPGTVPAGKESAHVGYFGDWMATAAELAGAKLPPGRDSLSFVPALLGRTAQQRRHEFLYWEFHERGFSQAALYRGRWKGICERIPDAPLALYDLRADIAEKTDIAARYPEIVAKLDTYLKSARSDSPDWPIQAAL